MNLTNDDSSVPERDDQGRMAVQRKKKIICHVALSQRSESRFNISGSKNSSLQVSSGSVLKA